MKQTEIGITTVIKETINKQEILKPIFNNELYFQTCQQLNTNINKKIFNAYLNRIIKKHETLRQYQKGIYYLTQQTIFGEAKLRTYEVIKKQYLFDNGKIIGYETGPAIMQQVGLTTQMANTTFIVSNKVNNSRYEKNKRLYLIKPLIEVNENNYKYLILLDIMANEFKLSLQEENPQRIYKEIFNNYNLDALTLIKYSSLYNNKLIIETVELIKEMENETTFNKKSKQF
ncbi:MAG: hypothetical protein LBM99_01970 [Bacillales bacterium]|jgi:hypothetical protein|nr:hypothetical protein [Bacillales bacterium]